MSAVQGKVKVSPAEVTDAGIGMIFPIVGAAFGAARTPVVLTTVSAIIVMGKIARYFPPFILITSFCSLRYTLPRIDRYTRRSSNKKVA